MRFVPFIGGIIAAFFPILLAAAVDPGWTMVLATAGLFLVAEPIAGHVSSTSMNCKASMCLPRTTRQTVRGVARSSPIGPHSSVQKSVEMTIATGDKPVC